MTISPDWIVRTERDGDEAAIRAVLQRAFPTAFEADLVNALRQDEHAWIPDLSLVAQSEVGEVMGYVAFTRCHIGDHPALCLAPVAVNAQWRKQGVAAAMIRDGLTRASELGESHIVVLGDPSYYTRFGFSTASRFGITLPMEVPDEASMALTLNSNRPLPAGSVRYAAAFGL